MMSARLSAVPSSSIAASRSCITPRLAPAGPVSRSQPGSRPRVFVNAQAEASPSGRSVVGEGDAVLVTGSGSYTWAFTESELERQRLRRTRDIPVKDIIRPLGRTRGNDNAKVEALMKSIQEVGLQEPIDVLEVDGRIYGFSGCHRFEAHQRLGLETIRCRVFKATQQDLRMHMM